MIERLTLRNRQRQPAATAHKPTSKSLLSFSLLTVVAAAYTITLKELEQL
jgi:hypothetical protein